MASLLCSYNSNLKLSLPSKTLEAEAQYRFFKFLWHMLTLQTCPDAAESAYISEFIGICVCL